MDLFKMIRIDNQTPIPAILMEFLLVSVFIFKMFDG